MSGVQRELPPMPSGIQSLRRDRRGYPIPFVAGWTSERETPGPPFVQRVLRVGDLEWEGNVVVELDTVGKGQPQLGRIEAGRQLLAHERSLCNVCGKLVGRRLTFVGGRAAEPEGQCYTEAPLHRACARWSLQVCPSLLSARQGIDTLNVTEITQADVMYHGVFMNAEADKVMLPAHPVFAEIGWGLIGVLAIVNERGRQQSATDYLKGEQ